MQSGTPTPPHNNITKHTTPVMLNSISTTAASSSAAAPAVDDCGSDGEAEPEESDDLIVSFNNDNNDGDNDNNDNDNDDNNNNDDVDKDIFFCPARDIQNRMSQNAGTAAMEDRCFRELFGASIGIVLQV